MKNDLIPSTKTQIKLHEPIVAMIMAIFGAALFLVFPQVLGVSLKDAGWTPVFSIPVLRSFWFPIVLVMFLGIAKETVKLIEGRFTKRLAAVTIAANILMLICAAVVWLNGKIMNPDFVLHIGNFFTGVGGKVPLGLLTNLNLLILCFIFFALILEIISTLIILRKYNARNIS